MGLIRDGEKGGKGVWRWGGEIIYLSLHCHHHNDFCIRWAAMRAILMFHNCEGQIKSRDSVHRPQLLKTKENRSRFEPRSFCLPAFVMPYRWAKPAHKQRVRSRM